MAQILTAQLFVSYAPSLLNVTHTQMLKVMARLKLLILITWKMSQISFTLTCSLISENKSLHFVLKYVMWWDNVFISILTSLYWGLSKITSMVYKIKNTNENNNITLFIFKTSYNIPHNIYKITYYTIFNDCSVKQFTSEKNSIWMYAQWDIPFG